MYIILSLFVIKGKKINSLVVVVLQYTLTCNNVNYKNHVNIYIHTPDSQKKYTYTHTNGFKSKILLLLVSRKTSLLFLILFNPNLKLSLKILYTKKKNKITHNNCQVELYPLLVPSSPSEIHILRPTTEQQREGKKEWRQVGESQ